MKTLDDSIWARLAEPLPAAALCWRADGKPTSRDGKFFARYVVYVEAGTVRERLDSVVPGEWDLTLEPLPPLPYQSEEDISVSFTAKLQVLGVIRQDVGTGKDYKSASTDAFKRVAVRFGIGHELYAMEQNWVQVQGSPLPSGGAGAPEQTGGLNSEVESCPKCGGNMWDNRLTKKNPRAPDYKCQNRSCDGVIWPPRGDEKKEPGKALTGTAEGPYDFEDFPGTLVPQPDDLPF